MSFDSFLAQSAPVILTEVVATRGSAPREAGAFMLVSEAGFWGTIGGGNLEFAAIARARAILAGGESSGALHFTLGPDSGQCCGGVVEVQLTRLDPSGIEALRHRYDAQQRQNPDVFVFGAGHVGRALAAALAPLPLRTVMIETRKEELGNLPEAVETRLTAIPESLVGDVRPGGAIIILTHDHALDFLIATEALLRNDLAYVGMIGSRTKRGVFAHHLARQGHDVALADRLVLPIGGSAVRDKRPEVIAALVAAELLAAVLSRRGD
jgi:xanthine dehydrogenase accessory factor